MDTLSENEVNAEKAAKPRPDLIPHTAVVAALNVDSPPLGVHMASVLWALTKFKRTLEFDDLERVLELLLGTFESVPHALMCAGEVMGYGFRKHGNCTWRVGGTEQADPQTHLAGLERHILEHWIDSQAREEGSGLPVLYHALSQWCILYDLIVNPPAGAHDYSVTITERLRNARADCI